MIRSRRFSRYNEAEKLCQELTMYRMTWRMFVEYDVEHLENDEIFVYDDYTVEWVAKGGKDFD